MSVEVDTGYPNSGVLCVLARPRTIESAKNNNMVVSIRVILNLVARFTRKRIGWGTGDGSEVSPCNPKAQFAQTSDMTTGLDFTSWNLANEYFFRLICCYAHAQGPETCISLSAICIDIETKRGWKKKEAAGTASTWKPIHVTTLPYPCAFDVSNCKAHGKTFSNRGDGREELRILAICATSM